MILKHFNDFTKIEIMPITKKEINLEESCEHIIKENKI